MDVRRRHRHSAQFHVICNVYFLIIRQKFQPKIKNHLHCSLKLKQNQLRFSQSVRHKRNKVSVSSGGRLTRGLRPLSLCLLVAVGRRRLRPLQLLLLQPLLLLLQVRRHVVEGHLVQVLEAAAGLWGGCGVTGQEDSNFNYSFNSRRLIDEMLQVFPKETEKIWSYVIMWYLDKVTDYNR